MKTTFTLFCLIFASAAFAAENCRLETQRVFLLGESHGSEQALETKNLMIQGSLHKKIYLGLEIDPIAVSKTLRPENQNAIFGMEEEFSKGFGVLYWSWWMTESRLLMPKLDARLLNEAVSSFHYFILRNTPLQKAWTEASPALINSSDIPVRTFVEIVNENLRKNLDPDLAEPPLNLDTVENKAATAVVLKAVLSAYVRMALRFVPETAPQFVPVTMARMKEILEFPAIVKGERNYQIYLRWFFDLGKQFQKMFVLDWRSRQMSRAIISRVCNQQQESLTELPIVAIVGANHLGEMQSILQRTGMSASLDYQPPYTSDFEALLEYLNRGPEPQISQIPLDLITSPTEFN